MNMEKLNKSLSPPNSQLCDLVTFAATVTYSVRYLGKWAYSHALAYWCRCLSL